MLFENIHWFHKRCVQMRHTLKPTGLVPQHAHFLVQPGYQVRAHMPTLTDSMQHLFHQSGRWPKSPTLPSFANSSFKSPEKTSRCYPLLTISLVVSACTRQPPGILPNLASFAVSPSTVKSCQVHMPMAAWSARQSGGDHVHLQLAAT